MNNQHIAELLNRANQAGQRDWASEAGTNYMAQPKPPERYSEKLHGPITPVSKFHLTEYWVDA